MITFKTSVKVFLDKKHIGDIKETSEGYQYFPRGSKVGGHVFFELSLCKASLRSK